MKPRILKGWDGEWWCTEWPNAEGWLGIGKSIEEAYQDWKAKNNR